MRNLFPGLQRVGVHRNIPQKRAQRVGKLPGTVKTPLQTMICEEIVSWTLTCRGAPKWSSETCSARRKTHRYSVNHALNYEWRRNRLVGTNVSRFTEIVLENVISASVNYDLRRNRLLGINVSRCTDMVPKNVLSASKNPHVQ